MEKEIELLKDWCQKINEHIETVSDYLTKCGPISNEYRKSKEDIQKDMFNVFYLVSDLYYRENFHSDIISFFLDTQEKHSAGSAFLDVFIQMLNKKGKGIDPYNYRDAVAIREKEDRIDILIKSESTKRAIIIENKINNAGDMWRQIPRYYEYVSHNYTIDAIVYLPLDISKEPYKGDWTEEDKGKVDPLLVIIPAYNKSGKINLVNDWLSPSILLSDDLDVVSTLRQYSHLIKKLNHNNMDTIVLEKFYNELLKDDNLKNAQSIRNMLSDIPAYLAIRIKERFDQKCLPFDKIWIYKDQDAVFEKAIIKGIYLKIDIWCYDTGYDMDFWTPDDSINEMDFTQLVQSMESLQDFTKQDNVNSYRKHFDFIDEKGLFASLNDVLNELKNIS